MIKDIKLKRHESFFGRNKYSITSEKLSYKEAIDLLLEINHAVVIIRQLKEHNLHGNVLELLLPNKHAQEVEE